MANKIIHVIGTGTIGEPLIGLLTDVKQDLGIDEVTFHKKTPLLTDRSKVTSLIKRDAKLCADKDAFKAFSELDMHPTFDTLEALDRASVVIDCTPSGIGHENKAKYYDKYKSNTLGFIAQGSEFGFGKMYARGINDQALEKGKDQFIHVVSCNTHNLAALIETLALQDEGPENLIEGRFLCIRRANDISQDKSYIPSPQPGKHKDGKFGTHHARDAWHLFNTLGYNLNLFSSAIKINSQYMHCIWFDIKVKKPTTLEKVIEKLQSNDRIAVTHKMSSNTVFSFGRDHGHYGRILNQTVICLPTLSVRDGNEIVGFCFTPQDGNSILSSVAAATWFLYPESYEQKIQCLKPFFFSEV